jgi:hypothetical protein
VLVPSPCCSNIVMSPLSSFVGGHVAPAASLSVVSVKQPRWFPLVLVCSRLFSFVSLIRAY